MEPEIQTLNLEEYSEELLVLPDIAMAVLYSLPDALVVIDESGFIRIVNNQAELLTGYHRSELKKRPVELIIPEELREKHREHRQRYMDNPYVRPMGFGYDLALLRKNGSQVKVRINLAPAITAKGAFYLALIRRVPSE